MIDAVSRTIEELLRQNLHSETVAQVSITFAAPDSEFPPSDISLPAVDLFLYDVRENLELRSSEWSLERRPDGSGTLTPPASRVDCSYLITAWSGANSPSRALEEHSILGEVMKVLLRFPVIPKPLLKGDLAAQGSLPTSTLLPSRLQGPGEFWQTLGGKAKATLHYTLTFEARVNDPSPTHLVTDRELRFQVKEPVRE